MTEDEIKLCRIFAEIANKKNSTEVRLESRISEFEMDSLDVVEILMKIYEEFNVDIPVDTFLFCDDVSSVYKKILKSGK